MSQDKHDLDIASMDKNGPRSNNQAVVGNSTRY